MAWFLNLSLRLNPQELGLRLNDLRDGVLQALSLGIPSKILPGALGYALRICPPRRILNLLIRDILDLRLRHEALLDSLVGNPLCHILPLVHTILSEEVAVGAENLRIILKLGILRRLYKGHQEVAQIVNMHVVPLDFARRNDRRVAILHQELGHVVHLLRTLVDWTAAWSVDGGWAHDGGLDTTGVVGGQH